MGEMVRQHDGCLSLDTLELSPLLSRRLPVDLALRCHALPLAEEHGRVTVVMAEPDNKEQRQQVEAVLGADSCIVRG